MSANISLLPCAAFFKAGRIGAGIATLCMQLSIVLWPMAVGRARAFVKQTNVELMLADYASKYPVPAGPHVPKHFGSRKVVEKKTGRQRVAQKV